MEKWQWYHVNMFVTIILNVCRYDSTFFGFGQQLFVCIIRESCLPYLCEQRAQTHEIDEIVKIVDSIDRLTD